MTERWYEKAIIYCLDVETFQDSDGDGVGDFAGLTRRLDYLARLGVDCLWLNPIHPSPGRDGGYEVSDYYNVHPRLGTLGDFAEFLQAADSRGIRVIIDLVVKCHRGCQQRRRRRRGTHRDARRSRLRGHRPSQADGRWLRLPLDLPAQGILPVGTGLGREPEEETRIRSA